MTRWRWLVASAVCGCATACSNAPPGEASGARIQSIVAGEPSGADQDGVVLLRAAQSKILCTASLVGPNLLVTARHCVALLSDGEFSCSTSGELIENPTGGGQLGLTVPPADLEVYAGEPPRQSPLAHGQQVVSTLSPTVCKDDLAFVVLDTALDLPVLPIRLGRPAQVHEPAVLVGYGTGAERELIDYATQPRRQKRGVDVIEVGPALDDGATTVPRALISEGPSGCVGDSGGPLLAASSGALLGVYSLERGDSCSAPTVRNQLVHVPAFETLIDEAFAAAGSEPVPEPTLGTAGAMAAGGASDPPDNNAGDAGGEPSAATGGAAGAGPEPEVKARDRSACSLAAPQGGAAGSARLVILLVLGAFGRRRRC